MIDTAATTAADIRTIERLRRLELIRTRVRGEVPPAKLAEIRHRELLAALAPKRPWWKVWGA